MPSPCRSITCASTTECPNRPCSGYKHFLLKRHIHDFVAILPDWAELSKGLKVILLAEHDDDADGWCDIDAVAVCAWPREEWIEVLPWYYEEHADIFERLGVPCEEADEGDWLCKFTAPTIRGYQLLHILLHELGHHHDRMTTRSKRRSSRGEPYAERYARDYERIIWERYCELFGLD